MPAPKRCPSRLHPTCAATMQSASIGPASRALQGAATDRPVESSEVCSDIPPALLEEQSTLNKRVSPEAVLSTTRVSRLTKAIHWLVCVQD